MIRLENVRKVYPTRFGEKLVLDGIGFELTKGQRLGVLGRNGAGKSTMIRLISGAERPTAGLIERHMSVSWPLAFGGAFQVMLTGQDNVRFISRIYGQDFESNLAFVEEFAELGPYLREPVRSYSAGMRARLAFAISMIIEFDCFLIDEIASVGDARFHHKCNYELFEKRADRAMVIISHDPGYVRDHCNRYAVLHEGKLSLQDEFDAAYDVYNGYLGLEVESSTAISRYISRSTALETLHRVALADERFRMHVQRGDWARDQGQWEAAQSEYATALLIHPYERTFWVQYGHVAKEQGKLVLAEIAYRTACALGQPLREVREFLQAVMAAQGVSSEKFPPRGLGKGAASSQPPAAPDLDILQGLLGSHLRLDDAARLDLLRSCPTLDDLAVQLVSATRSQGEPDQTPDARLSECVAIPAGQWRANLGMLVDFQDNVIADGDESDSNGIRAYFRDPDHLKAVFHDWPKLISERT